VKTDLIQTMPLAETIGLDSLVTVQASARAPTEAVLNSILAPMAKGNKSLPCVPVHPEAVVLQSLNGMVNKQSPPNLAKTIEVVGWLGGAPAVGSVACSFLQCLEPRTQPRDGIPGLVDALFPLLAKDVWAKLPGLSKDPTKTLPPWPGVTPVVPVATSTSLLASNRSTPFSWFWEKWSILCNRDNHWYDILPTRRFIDWAQCLLRTGLAFAYLWEAEFFARVHACLVERAKNTGAVAAFRALQTQGRRNTVIASIESPLVPASQKHAWDSMSNLLARGHEIRASLQEHLRQHAYVAPTVSTIDELVQEWLASLLEGDVPGLAAAPVIQPNTARNQKFFVRYLLQVRSSDDDEADQADFYYLTRTNPSDSFWLQPGPEWLVVVTSLLCRSPGGQCTLGMLIEDLARIGIRVERWVLVGMLEEAGLSMDSPDADNALVIRSGF
jgi:hypothetical protein